MESNDRRQRQSTQSGYAGQQGLLHGSTQQQYSASTGSQDRFRQSALTAQSPTTASSVSTARAGGSQGYGYGYGEGSQFVGSSLPSGSMQYQSDYAQDVQQRPQQQGQQYSQYGSNSMYNVSGQQQGTPQSPYESVQPYQPRQSAAIEVLSSQFGVPQQYYVEGGQGSAGAPTLASQNVQSQYSGLSYTAQSSSAQNPLAPAFAPNAMESLSGSSHGAYSQSYGASTALDFDNHYNEYQTRLRMTFECIRDGQLSKAGDLLMELTTWLLSNAELLGLVRDDETTYADKLKLWDDFNSCWLATLQRQKEMSQTMIETGQRPVSPQSLLEFDFMEGMGKDLVRLCDQMEKFGLVDYQMGVREEEIVTHLIKCLDLLDEYQSQAGTGQSSSSGLHR